MTQPVVLPAGFNLIPAGTFVDGYTARFKGKKVGTFAMKATPATNAEWGALSASLGRDRYVLLEHDFQTGETAFVRKGAQVTVAGPIEIPHDTHFDQGDVLISGSMVLLKMVDNPSVKYDDELGRRFSGAKQPAIGVSYFHALAWCFLKSQEEGGKYRYDLPTNLEYEYVASNGGRCDYGTEACHSLEMDGRKLAHIGHEGGTTAPVDDPQYEQNLPWGVQTTGNVERWVKFDSKYQGTYRGSGHMIFGYHYRGGSWSDSEHGHNGHATVETIGRSPDSGNIVIGFSPVIRMD